MTKLEGCEELVTQVRKYIIYKPETRSGAYWMSFGFNIFDKGEWKFEPLDSGRHVRKWDHSERDLAYIKQQMQSRPELQGCEIREVIDVCYLCDKPVDCHNA